MPIKLIDIYNAFDGKLLIERRREEYIELTKEYCKGFDLDMEFGQLGEDFIEGMQNGNNKIEVKTEREIWKKTGNIFIEIRFKGVESGLSTTDASVWIHLLYYNDKIESGLIFDVQWLKDRLKQLLNQKKAKIVMGGDMNMSQGVLVKIHDLLPASDFH